MWYLLSDRLLGLPMETWNHALRKKCISQPKFLPEFSKYQL